jgi:ribosomal protein S18 acetylase RimI-like enzyme
MIEALQAWAPERTYVSGLHAGDIGWHLRLDDPDIAETLVVVFDADEVVACALAEPGLMRPAFRPDRLDDPVLAAVMVEVASQLAGHRKVWSDAPSQSAYRAQLSANGWQLDPDPWAVFYRPLGAADAVAGEDSLSTTLRGDRDIADRVGVQFQAFEHSTFTVDRWQQMAAGPGFEPAVEILRRDRDGTPVAAATGWLAGPGRVAILEPVGTHRDHTRAGHGAAVCRAAMAALARCGASGVTIATPGTNHAAISTYLSCGLTLVDLEHAMVSPSS